MANYGDETVGAAAVNLVAALIPDFRVWHIKNTDTGETLDGQFEATDLTKTVGSNWSRQSSIGRQHPISQFLNGEADRISFKARFFRRDTTAQVKDDIDLLTSWVKRDLIAQRPPICLFWVGDGSVYMTCVIEGVSNIVYDTLTFGGGVRGATMQVNLVQYTEFKFLTAPAPETRYAHAEQGAYHELLAVAEYGNPMLGVIIRQRSPTQQTIETGEIVKLPSLEAIQRIKIEPQSSVLRTVTTKASTPQRLLRDEVYERLNRSYVSHVVPRGF